MSKVYKRLVLFILLICAISGAVIYYTIDINTLHYLVAFQPWSLMAVAVLMAVGMYFDGTRLLHLVGVAGQRITLRQAVQVIFSNYFLALLTPGASGGVVAQVFFLRRAGISTGIASVVVLIRTLMSLLVLFLCLPVIFLYDPGLLPWIPSKVLIGVSCAIVGGSIFVILFLRSKVSARFLFFLTKKLSVTGRKKVITIFRDVRGAVIMLAAAPLSMLRVFAESAMSILSLYSMVPVLFLGLGISFDWPMVLGRMVLLNILLYFAPTPGGSGIAEGGFVLLFKELLPPGTVGILAVAWRIVAEYLPFCIGLYFSVKVFGRDFLLKQLKKGE